MILKQPILPGYAGGKGRKKVTYDKYAYSPVLADLAMRYFIAKGLEPHQAAGLVGNFLRESRLNHRAFYNDKSGGAYGIAQWRGSRQQELFKMYGRNPSLLNQLDFVWYEMNKPESRALKYLRAARTAEEAARYGMGYYEFSAGPEGAIANMNKYGQNGEASMADGINFANRVYSTYKPAPTYQNVPLNDGFLLKPVLLNHPQYNPQPHYGSTSAYLDRNTSIDPIPANIPTVQETTPKMFVPNLNGAKYRQGLGSLITQNLR